MQVLDHGELELEAWLGSDLSVVNAARVSLNKRSAGMNEAEEKLIGYLMKNKHGTPFEHNCFIFRVKAPIFVFREWHRHRVGHSYNEWSARYSELKPEFYIPENVRTQVGKVGAYTYEAATEQVANDFTGLLRHQCAESFDRYKWAIAEGVAKEQARFFLPVNIYSEMFWTCNARSLMHFLSLRAAPSAMWEIRQYADTAEQIFLNIMPVTHAAFVSNGRIAP